MIDGNDDEGYTLYCDICSDACDELFELFSDVVDYKKDRVNGWASVKGKNGEWNELCPECNRPDIIAKLKGTDCAEPPKPSGKELARLAGLADAELEGF